MSMLFGEKKRMWAKKVVESAVLSRPPVGQALVQTLTNGAKQFEKAIPNGAKSNFTDLDFAAMAAQAIYEDTSSVTFLIGPVASSEPSLKKVLQVLRWGAAKIYVAERPNGPLTTGIWDFANVEISNPYED